MLQQISNYKYKVALDGSGLDEFFAGYSKYKRFLSSTGVSHNNKHHLLAQDGSIPYERSIINKRLMGNYKDYVEIPQRLRGDSPLQTAINGDLFCFKLPRALRFRDRLSMFYGVELRPSFLNQEIYEFSLQVSEKLKIKKGITKYLVRKTASYIIDSNPIQQFKQNVQTPQTRWLSSYLYE